MTEHTKSELEFLNILMSAWIAGWYAGCDGQKTDDKKRIDCPELMKRCPEYVAALDLLAACKLTCTVCFRKKADNCKDCKVGKAIAKAEAQNG